MLKKIIQVGSCNGFDGVWEMIKNNTFESILIEPNPRSMDVLKKNYAEITNIHYENIAISTVKGKKCLFIDNYDSDKYNAGVGVTPHASFDINFQYAHLHGMGRDEITALDVECYTISDIIKKYHWENDEIDYLFIDTEGHDCDIILATDFSKFKIKCIKFETTHADGPFTKGQKLQNTINHLLGQGYNTVKFSTYDMIFARDYKIYDL